MGGAPKVSTMNNDRIILAHWDMADCLMAEVADKPLAEGIHGPWFIEDLFHAHASHDPRFHVEGFFWHQKGYLQYNDWGTGQQYYGEAAIAAFLGLGVVGQGRRMQASKEALRFVYREFADRMEARDWLRWHVQKMHGFTCKAKEMDVGRPRQWPKIIHDNFN